MILEKRVRIIYKKVIKISNNKEKIHKKYNNKIINQEKEQIKWKTRKCKILIINGKVGKIK